MSENTAVEIKKEDLAGIECCYIGEVNTSEKLVEEQEYEPKSRILVESDSLKSYKESLNYMRSDYYKDKLVTLEELDKDCMIIDSVINKEIIESFPEYLCDRNHSGKYVDSSIAYRMRQEYIKYGGWSIITKEFINELSAYLLENNFKCLEIMAGKAVITSALKDKGVDIIATDDKSWSKFIESGTGEWCDVEDLEASEAIKKYSDVDVIIASWMPIDMNSIKIVRNIRKYNPDVLIITIGEGWGGCTANDEWFSRVYEVGYCINEARELSFLLPSWWGIHDIVNIYKVTKPWKGIDIDYGFKNELNIPA